MGHVAAAKLFGEKLISWLPVFYRSWLKKGPCGCLGQVNFKLGKQLFKLTCLIPNETSKRWPWAVKIWKLFVQSQAGIQGFSSSPVLMIVAY